MQLDLVHSMGEVLVVANLRLLLQLVQISHEKCQWNGNATGDVPNAQGMPLGSGHGMRVA